MIIKEEDLISYFKYPENCNSNLFIKISNLSQKDREKLQSYWNNLWGNFFNV